MTKGIEFREGGNVVKAKFLVGIGPGRVRNGSTGELQDRAMSLDLTEMDE